MPRATTPGAINQPQQAETSLPEVGKRKLASFLEADTVKGSVLQGKAKATVSATLTNIDGDPLTQQTIHFKVASSGMDLGSAPTNANGQAILDIGQHISDIQAMITGGLSGYVAEYKGSANFAPSSAKGSFNATI
ncbi:Ig-like domain-containing protein [Kitasatospora sp. NPDC057223]|uniref:Ig-like domain-containing protein n=1 Tax=Kitasatospora sp. NPDC057223 TaxID=3346055 RepID=UPI0036362212